MYGKSLLLSYMYIYITYMSNYYFLLYRFLLFNGQHVKINICFCLSGSNSFLFGFPLIISFLFFFYIVSSASDFDFFLSLLLILLLFFIWVFLNHDLSYSLKPWKIEDL